MAQDRNVILLVEDDPNDQILIRRSLQQARTPTRIIVANDGDEVLSYLSESASSSNSPQFPLPCLLLLDLKLPRRSGLEVLAWIRRHPKLNGLPVVMLTSSDEEIDIRRARDLGANSYLVKPVDLADLNTLLARVADYCVSRDESLLQPP